MHEPVGQVQFGVFEKFTSAYLFQIAQEKSCDYLLIIYIKNFEMVKQKKHTCITQSGKNYAINCAILGVRLIWKWKIWFVICEFLWSLTNQNACFCFFFCILFRRIQIKLNHNESNQVLIFGERGKPEYQGRNLS